MRNGQARKLGENEETTGPAPRTAGTDQTNGQIQDLLA